MLVLNLWGVSCFWATTDPQGRHKEILTLR